MFQLVLKGDCSFDISRRDGAMSALLTGIVVVLVICHSPKTIINMLESYQVDVLFIHKNCYSYIVDLHR